MWRTVEIAWAPRRPLGKRRLGRHAMLLAGLLVAATANASDAARLITLINDYRTAANACDGRRTQPVGPLAPERRLARVRVTTGAQLQQAFQKAGYRAAKAQAIVASGPANPQAAMAAIRRRYCSVLLNPQYAEIGISRSANTWQIVLARPLLSRDLGSWEQAGREVLKQVNEARAQPRSCGRQAFDAAPPLTWNARLASSALAHSHDMAERNYFSHRGADGNYADVRAGREGYNWRRIGENIAAGQSSAQQTVSGWLASPGHCANIMNPDFTEMGAAYAVKHESDVGIYWTQVFGEPR